jgi:RNA polymerase sigma factor (sigma-70 family)
MASLFPTTRRSVVLALRSDDTGERTRAFDTLVAIYWKPLYKFARMTWGRSAEDAEDLTQAFFARVFERESLAGFDARKAAFRTYLRIQFERHAANENRAAMRIKRGGGAAALDFAEAEAEAELEGEVSTPEELFYQDWVRGVFAVAISRMREQVSAKQFALFEAYDLAGDRKISYRDLAERFALPETTVTNQLFSARRKFREAVLDTLREATATDDEFRTEARALLGVER